MKKTSLFIVALAATMVSASASLISIANRAVLGASDLLDWSQAGAAFDYYSSTPLSTAGGITATASLAGGTALARVDEGGLLTSGWEGNFSAGEALIYTDLEPGPLYIDFATPVFGGGAQIQAQFPGPFTASLEAFDTLGVSLGSFSYLGNSTGLLDGSAIFIGLRSDVASIARLAFNVTDSADPTLPPLTDFAINRVSLVTAKTSSVPEGGAVLGLFAATTALMGLVRARRSDVQSL